MMFLPQCWLLLLSATSGVFSTSEDGFCSNVYQMHRHCVSHGNTVLDIRQGKAGPRGAKGEKGAPATNDYDLIDRRIDQKLSGFEATVNAKLARCERAARDNQEKIRRLEQTKTPDKACLNTSLHAKPVSAHRVVGHHKQKLLTHHRPVSNVTNVLAPDNAVASTTSSVPAILPTTRTSIDLTTPLIRQKVCDEQNGTFYGGVCFWALRHISKDMTYYEARRICKSNGPSRLADISGKDHFDAMMRYLRTTIPLVTSSPWTLAWTGMKVNTMTGVTMLSTGEVAPYTENHRPGAEWDMTNSRRTLVYLYAQRSSAHPDQGFGNIWPSWLWNAALCQI